MASGGLAGGRLARDELAYDTKISVKYSPLPTSLTPICLKPIPQLYFLRCFLGNKLLLPRLEESSPFRLVLALPSLILQPTLGAQELKEVLEKVNKATKNKKGRLRKSLFFKDFI